MKFALWRRICSKRCTTQTVWVLPRNRSDKALQLTVIDVSDAESRPSQMWIAGEEVDPKEHMPLILINPELQLGEELEIGTEGCLSFPEITAEIPRAAKVKVNAQDLQGNRIEFEAAGLLGRAVQHETDHLNGILFIDRMSSAAKASLAGKLKRLAAESSRSDRSRLARVGSVGYYPVHFRPKGSLSDTHPASDRENRAWVMSCSDRASHSFARIPGGKVPRPGLLPWRRCYFVYFFTCGVPRLFDQIDGQYAGAAREMMERGDWLTPTQNGVPRLQKPPLVYWCEILSMSVFGVNEFGARFPVALATVGWFLATGLLARRVVGTWSAGARRCADAGDVHRHFFLCSPRDAGAFFQLFPGLVILVAAEGDANDGPPERKGEINQWLMVAWTFIALSTLTKGIHGLLIPVAALSFTAWLRPSMRVAWRKFLFRPHGWLLLLAVLGPWYLADEWRYPGFLKDHFFNEQIGSALSRRLPPDSDRVPLWIFWLEHLVLLFPISLLFPAAVRAALQRRKDRRPWVSDDGFLLLGVVSRRCGRDQFCQRTGLLSDDRVGARGGLDRLGRHQKRDFL